MTRRILVTGIWHETNTFSVRRTDLAAFRAYQYAEGTEVLDQHEGTNTEIGGMMEAAPRHDFALQPALFAGAVPSGLITREAFEHIVEVSCRRAEELAPLDGALVALHGAMVAEGVHEADAHLLARLREVLGRACPLVATFDFHANLSEALVANADVLIGYDTYPHIDMAERGREAAAVLAQLIESDGPPTSAFRKLPMVSAAQVQCTNEPPMRDVMSLLAEAERRSGILLGSIAAGFPYADVPQLGMSVLAYGREPQEVNAVADGLAEAIWSRRDAFVPHLLSVAEAVATAMAAARGPVILVDVADNVGGGSPGDGTVVLEALLTARPRSAALVLWDPDAVATATECGTGSRFREMVGGKADRMHGSPVKLEGKVEFVGPVEYQRESTYMTGQLIRLGNAAVVNATGVRVVLTEERVMPFDSTHLRIVGIEPEDQDIIVVKSAIAWRAAFGDIAARELYVDTPGICASNLKRFSYSHRPSKLYPLEVDFEWSPSLVREARRRT